MKNQKLIIKFNSKIMDKPQGYQQDLYQYFPIQTQQISQISIKMKQIFSVIEGYLRRFPVPTSIQMISNSLLKLNYSFTIPYTNSKNIKQVIYPIKNPELTKPIQTSTIKLKYDEKGRLQQSASFQTISCQGKHDKILQDDVFGQAKQSQNKNRWVYIAQVKQQKPKSYFNKGQGKTPFQYDFGQTYEGVKNVKIFVWDKSKRQILKIQTPSSLIPACPIFSNAEGSKILFHAYRKSQFGHGILHCFNREVGIYEVDFTIQDEVEDFEKQCELTKKKIKSDKQRLSKLGKLVEDKRKTNIFPSISKCFNYLVYCSGTGKTHTYYLDLVVMKRQKDNQNKDNWVELHRIKQKLVGYYSTLKLFPSIDKNNRPICYFQSIEQALQRIYKIDLQSGQVTQFSQHQCGQSFAISEVLQESGAILGTTTTHNFNTFFYTTDSNQKIHTIPPPDQEKFTLQEYNQPIHGYYLEAPQQTLLPEYKSRANNRPMVLLAHGGPHGAVDPTLTLFRYTLLKMGYSILMPNFPGSAGYGQQYLQKALKNIGQTDMDSIILLLSKVLAQKPYIDKKKVHVYGGSYGGYTGAILGSRYSQYFASVVILNGVLSIPSQLYFTDIPEWNTVETLGKQDLHNLTAEDFAEMYRQSPISEPMKIPVLQFLGAKDLRVPYRQGLLFDAITRKQGGQISTFVYENSSHSLADSVDTIIDVIIKSMLFLEGELKRSQDKGEEQREKHVGDRVVILQRKEGEMKEQYQKQSSQKIQQEMKQNQNL